MIIFVNIPYLKHWKFCVFSHLSHFFHPKWTVTSTTVDFIQLIFACRTRWRYWFFEIFFVSHGFREILKNHFQFFHHFDLEKYFLWMFVKIFLKLIVLPIELVFCQKNSFSREKVTGFQSKPEFFEKCHFIFWEMCWHF